MTTTKTATAQKDIRLIENFIQSEEEERILLSNVFTNGEEEESEEKGGCEEKRNKERGKEGTLLTSWKVLSGRRVKTFGGTVNAQKTIGERLPNFLKDLCHRIEMDERVKETLAPKKTSKIVAETLDEEETSETQCLGTLRSIAGEFNIEPQGSQGMQCMLKVLKVPLQSFKTTQWVTIRKT